MCFSEWAGLMLLLLVIISTSLLIIHAKKNVVLDFFFFSESARTQVWISRYFNSLHAGQVTTELPCAWVRCGSAALASGDGLGF